MKKRLLSAGLALVMGLVLFPVSVLKADAAGGNWYDTYQDFLMNKEYLKIKNPEWDFDPYWSDNATFALRDIDNNGIPELLVVDNDSPNSAGWMTYVLGYTGGSVYWAGEAGNLGPAGVVSEDPNYPGLFAENGRGGFGYCEYFTLGNGTVVSETVLESTFGSPEYEERQVTDDTGLYNAYKNSSVLQDYNYGQIESMGWDAFATLYGYQKPETAAAGFSDVKEGAWYAADVADIQKYGLINGHPDGTFRPQEKLTLAQAITLAARTHAQLNGKGDIRNGSPWYQPYVDYAAENGLCSAGEFGTDYNGECSRLTMAVLFQRAFPTDTEQALNDISTLPDVEDSGYGSSVFYLYRQGVLTGNDEFGTFKPDKSVSRAESSAILNRVMDVEKRKSFSLKEGDTSSSETDDPLVDLPASVAYYGDRSACRLTPSMAAAYLKVLESLPKTETYETYYNVETAPLYAALLDIAGDGYPLLATTYYYGVHDTFEPMDSSGPVTIWEYRDEKAQKTTPPVSEYYAPYANEGWTSMGTGRLSFDFGEIQDLVGMTELHEYTVSKGEATYEKTIRHCQGYYRGETVLYIGDDGIEHNGTKSELMAAGWHLHDYEDGEGHANALFENGQILPDDPWGSYYSYSSDLTLGREEIWGPYETLMINVIPADEMIQALKARL